ncbi:hypothetical protein NX059_000851 [Plenodomus lindquistii]|nr:hypothetical protein NX059_000851 [Plenodomus lindquistii]
MAPLTYQRLLTRLDAQFDDLPTLFDHPSDEERLHDVMRAIRAGQISAQRGVDGDADELLSPGQLKHWVNAKVAKIHEHYDAIAAAAAEPDTNIAASSYTQTSPQPSQAAGEIYIDQKDGAQDSEMEEVIQSIEVEATSPTSDSSKENKNIKREHSAARTMPPPKPGASAVTKRIIRGNDAYAGVKKTVRKPTRTSARTRTRAAAAVKSRILSPAASVAVVENISDRDAAIALMNLCAPCPAADRERRAPAPSGLAQMGIPVGAYDRGAAPDDIFLAGVRYAMDNYELVKSQMGGNGKDHSKGFWNVV